MIYNVQNTSGIGKPCRIFDANGLEWDDIEECDTETGRMIQFKRDAEGRLVDHEGELIRETVYGAPPLQLRNLDGSLWR